MAGHRGNLHRVTDQETLRAFVDTPNNGARPELHTAVVRLAGDHWQAASIRKDPQACGGEKTLLIFDPRQTVQFSFKAAQRNVRSAAETWSSFLSRRPQTIGRMFTLGTQHDDISGPDFASYFIRQMHTHDDDMHALHQRIIVEAQNPEWLRGATQVAERNPVYFNGPLHGGSQNLWITNNLNLIRSVNPRFLAKLLVHQQSVGMLVRQVVDYNLRGVPVSKRTSDHPTGDLVEKFSTRPVMQDYNPSILRRREKTLNQLRGVVLAAINRSNGEHCRPTGPMPKPKRPRTVQECG